MLGQGPMMYGPYCLFQMIFLSPLEPTFAWVKQLGVLVKNMDDGDKLPGHASQLPTYWGDLGQVTL